jgi:hypothetical protein
MNRQRISEILDGYRPGEDLESIPEVREALDALAADPELSELHQKNRAVDRAMAEGLQNIVVPSSLQEQILKAHEEAVETPAVIRWLHPSLFAIAASVVILLALTFTFWSRPEPTEAARLAAADPAPFTPALASGDAVIQQAIELFQSRPRAHIGKSPDTFKAFLASEGATLPEQLPNALAWDHSIACDVVRIDGVPVSIVCFNTEDKGKLHLISFPRKDFPLLPDNTDPRIRSGKDHPCWANWCDDKLVHVLYADRGESALRSALDI